MLDLKKRWTPIICHSEIRDSYKEIVYQLPPSKVYAGKNVRILSEVNFIDYRNDAFNTFNPYDNINKDILSYAYGILINPYHTRLAVLDFDNSYIVEMNRIACELIKLEEVIRIDIIRSSISGIQSWHMHLALKDYYNIFDLYKNPIRSSCEQFNKYVLDTEEIILRVSNKFIINKNDGLFYYDDKNSLKYYPTISKLGEYLSLNDAVKPMIFSTYNGETEETKTHINRIKLRRRKNEYSFMQAKRPFATAKSSSKDFSKLSAALS